MRLTKWFKVNGEDREFLHLFGSTDKGELEPFKRLVKQQGGMYRITKQYGCYTIWDARF